MLENMSIRIWSRLARSFSSALSTYTILRRWPLEIELKIQKYRQGNRKGASGRQVLAIDRWVDAVRRPKKKNENDCDRVT
jgi:hypothetical protein